MPTTTIVKALYGSDCRRFKITDASGVVGLQRKLASLFPDLGVLSLGWKDEEGDIISIVNDDDLTEAIEAHEGRPVRILLASMSPQEPPLSTEPAARSPQPTVGPTQSLVLKDAPPLEPMAPQLAGAEQANQPQSSSDFNVDAGAGTGARAEAELLSKHPTLGEFVHAVFGAVHAAVQQHAKHQQQPNVTPATSATDDGSGERSGRGGPRGFYGRQGRRVHHGIVCDVTNITPIVGIRFHKIGVDYDLCEAEFEKLAEAEKQLYEAIRFPGAMPITYAEHVARKQQRGKSRCSGAPGAWRHMRQVCGGFPRPRPAPRGETLPEAGIECGSFGPGVAQLQHFLVGHGLMHPAAISYRTGFYGPHTAQSISQFQLEAGLTDARSGALDKPTLAALLHLDASAVIEKASEAEGKRITKAELNEAANATKIAAKEAGTKRSREKNSEAAPRPTEEKRCSAPTTSTSEVNLEVVQVPDGVESDGGNGTLLPEPEQTPEEKPEQEQEPDQEPEPNLGQWAAELHTLQAMGFLPSDELRLLLDQTKGSINALVPFLLAMQ